MESVWRQRSQTRLSPSSEQRNEPVRAGSTGSRVATRPARTRTGRAASGLRVGLEGARLDLAGTVGAEADVAGVDAFPLRHAGGLAAGGGEDFAAGGGGGLRPLADGDRRDRFAPDVGHGGGRLPWAGGEGAVVVGVSAPGGEKADLPGGLVRAEAQRGAVRQLGLSVEPEAAAAGGRLAMARLAEADGGAQFERGGGGDGQLVREIAGEAGDGHPVAAGGGGADGDLGAVHAEAVGGVGAHAEAHGAGAGGEFEAGA